MIFCRTNILDEETTEDFVSDILQEVVSDSLDQIYYKIIGERIIPYTVDVAKNLLLEVIEVSSIYLNKKGQCFYELCILNCQRMLKAFIPSVDFLKITCFFN